MQGPPCLPLPHTRQRSCRPEMDPLDSVLHTDAGGTARSGATAKLKRSAVVIRRAVLEPGTCRTLPVPLPYAEPHDAQRSSYHPYAQPS